MSVTLSMLLALALDRLLGEPRRVHPLVLFGGMAQRIEVVARRVTGKAPDATSNPAQTRLAGALAWGLLVLLPTSLLFVLLSYTTPLAGYALAIVVLYFCIGGRSLAEHAQAIQRPLAAGDLDTARNALSMIVSRDTAALDDTAVATATVESVLENGSDAVVAPLFWFVLAGAPGALCYRLTNTLDAMWGYRNEQYREFGLLAARADDLLNRPPAILTALSYALCGDLRKGLGCWSQQAPACDSPNGGPVMAAGAGALEISLGGDASYGGTRRQRPVLGEGPVACARDITRALTLLWRATLVLLVVAAVVEFLSWI